MDDLTTWWSVSDMAHALSVTTQWAYRLIEDGAVRAVRTRAGWLVDPQAVRDLAAAREAARKVPRMASGAGA